MAEAKKTLKDAAEDKLSGAVKVTVSGIDVTVKPVVLNDIDVIDALAEIEDGNILKLPKLLKLVFGEDWKRIKDGLRNEDGRVEAGIATQFFLDVFNEAGQKN